MAENWFVLRGGNNNYKKKLQQFEAQSKSFIVRSIVVAVAHCK
jgi:hypothetical protein